MGQIAGMKAYVLTTGIVFVLVIAAHVARLAAEGLPPLQDPSFVFTSVLAAALVVWAARVLRQLSPPREQS
jgi:hypothetical protein